MGNSESKQRRKFEVALEGLRSNKVSGKLKLSRCGLDSNDAAKLVEALRQNNNNGVTELILWDNRLGPKGAEEIAKALTEKTNSLQVVDVGGNEIGDEGANYLALALQENVTIKELLLQDNGIGDGGAKAIANALQTNNTLQQLYLHVNNIEAEGMSALIRAMKTNKTLYRLETYGNKAPADLENQMLDEGGSVLAKEG